MEVIHLTEINAASAADRVASLLRRGGVVAIPTDTVYGLAADVIREDAVRKVFRAKARSHMKALPIFVRDIAQAKRYAYIDARLERILAELWPGRTTVVLKKRPTMPELVTGGGRTVGLRIPDHPFVRLVLERVGRPITGTSANLTGSEPAHSGVAVQNTFRRHIPQPDLLVDAGELSPSRSSTVFDLTHPENPKILRMGAITKRELDELIAQWARTNAA